MGDGGGKGRRGRDERGLIFGGGGGGEGEGEGGGRGRKIFRGREVFFFCWIFVGGLFSFVAWVKGEGILGEQGEVGERER